MNRFVFDMFLFPHVWHFGITIGYYDTLKAYGFGINLGAGAIIIGYLI